MDTDRLLKRAKRTLVAANERFGWQGDEDDQAWDLLAHLLGRQPDLDEDLSDDVVRRFEKLVRRRTTGEPMAFILGWVDFLDFRMKVKPGAFVPRLTSEFLAQQAIRRMRGRSRPVHVDVATGIGPVAIASARALPRAEVYGLDISRKAIAQAKSNAASGEVLVLGRPPSDPSVRRQIGYAPQGSPGRTVLPVSVIEVVGAGITPMKPLISRLGPKDRTRVDRALDSVGLNDLSRECIFELSGGQQQRAFLARALVGDPPLLLLDEPTTGIDRAFRPQLVAELRRRADAGSTVVVVSHDPEDFHLVVDRILAVEDGVIRDISHDEYHEARP